MDPKLQTMMRAYQRARSEGDDARARRYGQMVAQYRSQTSAFEAAAPAPERYEVEHFGHTVEVRRGRESEDLAAFREGDDFYNTIDHSMNAHAGARAAVGSLDKPEDRLATLRGYYDDVVPYGEDNFLFIHPDTGRPTLYNSIDGVSPLDHLKDFGSDVVSLSRDWAIRAAGGAGAVGGAVLGGAAMAQQEVQGTLKQIIGQLGTPEPTKFRLGEAAQQATENAEAAFRRRSSAAYEAAFDAIGRDTPVQLSRIKALEPPREVWRPDLLRGGGFHEQDDEQIFW